METSAPIGGIEEAGSSRNQKPMQMPESVKGCDYEVFLSFRGPDTRMGITDHLYCRLIDAGVRTYRDDEELRIGEEIGLELLQAIEQSQISIPIFSEGYASSKWCLNELTCMVECKKNKGQIIMPIFYRVKPAEVRYQKEGYGKALLEHKNKKRVDDETILKWKAALNEVGGLYGWDVENRHEGELVKEIVTKVLSELKKAYLVVTDFLIGVDDNVKEILRMMGTITDYVKIVGIHGLGGIGKTTLAKVVYNKLSRDFVYCCFLDDVRENSKSKGLVYLQNRLISDLSKRTLPSANCWDKGIQMIEERFIGKKAIILLDDVDEKSQLTALLGRRCCFGPGSLILITTRNAGILHEFNVNLIYQVGELDSNRSLQLFSKHAFRRDHPPPEKLELSCEIVRIARGFPLLLEVMGSTLSLCGQNEIWDEYMEMWKRGHIKEIQNTLMISYNALDSCQRQIFLDIACLFTGCDKNDAIYMWKDLRLCPMQGLEVLQMMSIIKIVNGNKLWMHDHFRDLGREIVSQDSKGELAQKSRLWNPKEALDVLLRKKRNEKLEALCLNFEEFWEHRLRLEVFAVLPNLRFLLVYSQSYHSSSLGFLSKAALLWHNISWLSSPVKILKRKKQLLPNLRWIMWQNFPWRAPVVTYFSMDNLIVLDISWSEITHDWDGWRYIKGACKLKVLNLTSCTRLTKTPNLSKLPTLERLILDGCCRLAEISSSIGELRNLIFLSLISCRELRSLPEELGGLPSLEELLLDETSIREIPEWWASKKLKNPNVHDSPTSGSISYPSSLSNLSLMSTPISHLPNSTRALTSLERLNLNECSGINGLPYSIGDLRSLTELDLFETGITELPDSIESLENLKALIVSNRHQSKGISVLPKLPVSLTFLVIMLSLVTIPDLSNLINLNQLVLFMSAPNISGPSEMVQVPMPWWLGKLSKLQSLILSIPHMVNLSSELGALSHLKFLYLLNCKSLQCVPQIPSSVSKLRIMGCRSLTTLDISNLKNLSELCILGTPVKDLSGHELLDNTLEERENIIHTIKFVDLVNMALDEHTSEIFRHWKYRISFVRELRTWQAIII